jgi:exopolysaccharide biosynthesis polyprenyl glycosylphosphotransferase
MGPSGPPVQIATAAPEAAPLVRSRRGQRDSAVRRLLALSDAVSVLTAVLIALVVSGQALGPQHRLLWSLPAVPLMVLLFKLYGLYDRDAKRISHSTTDDLPALFHATVIGSLLLWLYSRYSPMGRLDFLEMLLVGGGLLVLVLVGRSITRHLGTRLIGAERALLVGRSKMGHTLAAKLAAHPEHRLEVVGLLAPSGVAEPDEREGLPRLGDLEQFDEVVARHKVSRVIFSFRDVDEYELEALLRRCRVLALKVSTLPGLSDVLGPAVEVDDIEGITVLGVNPPWLPRSSRALKRAMDIAIAGPLLVMLSPLLLLIAVAITVESHGPVLFTQRRVGKGGKRFTLLKFRTMVSDAEQRRDELLAQSTDPHWLKLDHDPRITRLGRHLRRFSLDELPQLWNVLRGEMSIVGPRPLIEADDERVAPWARGRLDLTPGLTGYWQVLGRTRIPFEEMVKLDYLYVMNWSLWEDMRLMLKTLPAVLGGRGAN